MQCSAVISVMILAVMLEPGTSFLVLLPGRLVTDTHLLPGKRALPPPGFIMPAAGATPDTHVHAPKCQADLGVR